ncbi:MAG: hypothetical protein JO268_18800 [Pseudonocardiales bacterium]|nr:hypothetical protein [Pseudonocardiales bacterium]
MTNPRPPEGGAGAPEAVSTAARRSQGTPDTRHAAAVQLPVQSLVTALDLLDDLDLCYCWVAPRRRRCRAVRR